MIDINEGYSFEEIARILEDKYHQKFDTYTYVDNEISFNLLFKLKSPNEPLVVFRIEVSIGYDYRDGIFSGVYYRDMTDRVILNHIELIHNSLDKFNKKHRLKYIRHNMSVRYSDDLKDIFRVFNDFLMMGRNLKRDVYRKTSVGRKTV